MIVVPSALAMVRRSRYPPRPRRLPRPAISISSTPPTVCPPSLLSMSFTLSTVSPPSLISTSSTPSTVGIFSMPSMLIVFDLDGTLIDSARDLADSTNEMLAAYGAGALERDAVGNMVGEGARKLVERALAARGLDAPIDEALARFRAIYDRRLTIHTRPYPGVADTIRTLAGRARLAVLTNKPETPARRLVEAFGWSSSFDWVMGGDGPFPRKPDPSGLMELGRLAGLTAGRTLLVGDSPIDVETGRRAGVRLCLARYGFGFHPDRVQVRDDDLVVDDPRDMARVLSGVLADRSRV